MTSPDYANDFLSFRRDMCPVGGEWGPSPIIPEHLEAWYSCVFPDGNPAARNVLDARTKKQGKSADAAAVALYMATRQSNGEVVIASADLAQSKDRVLKACKFAVNNGPLADHAKVFKIVIEFDNGSVIEALPQDWRGAAGGNYRAVIFDELHTYTLEGQRRLFDELIIPPTQPNGVRWIASYAGWLGESELLHEWWNYALGGELLSGGLPFYRNQEAGLVAFIDVGEESWRMPWITPEYVSQVRLTERPNSFRRLWLNDWLSNESQFITAEQWAACYDPNLQPGNARMVLGADASTSRDLTVLVGVTEQGERTEVHYVRVWKPEKGGLRGGKPTVDLAGIDAEVRRLAEEGLVAAVVYDPYQLHSLALEWEREGITCHEMPQTAQRTEADQALYDAIIQRKLTHFNHPVLNEHVLNAVAKETPRGFRLDKSKTSLKIDAAVALSMANQGATSGYFSEPLFAIVSGFGESTWRSWEDNDSGIVEVEVRETEAEARQRLLQEAMDYD